MLLVFWKCCLKVKSILVRAWDPDFTRLTLEEANRLAVAEKSGFVDEKDIDWENLRRTYQ